MLFDQTAIGVEERAESFAVEKIPPLTFDVIVVVDHLKLKNIEGEETFE